MIQPIHHQVRTILTSLPSDALLVSADAYEDEDFPVGHAGVLVEFSTGHMHLLMLNLDGQPLDPEAREALEDLTSRFLIVALVLRQALH